MKDANKANREFCFDADGTVSNGDTDFYWEYHGMEVSLEDHTIDQWGDGRTIGGCNAYNMATGSVTISQAQSVAEMLEYYLRTFADKGHTIDACWERYNDCDEKDDDVSDVVLSVITASIWKDYLDAAITALAEHGFYDDDEDDDEEY